MFAEGKGARRVSLAPWLSTNSCLLYYSTGMSTRSSSVDNDGDSIITDGEVPTATNPSSSTSAASLQPSGPVCSFGARLGYTYFTTPSPRPEVLNQLQGDIHFFTVDDQLVYLSFFQDSGPLNAACL